MRDIITREQVLITTIIHSDGTYDDELFIREYQNKIEQGTRKFNL